MRNVRRAVRRVGAVACAALATAAVTAAPVLTAPSSMQSKAPPAQPPTILHPPTILSVALEVAAARAVPMMRGEENLTWQGQQLTELTRLLSRAGRLDEAQRLVRELDTPDRVKSEAYAPIAIAALRSGDRKRALDIAEKLARDDEWTAPLALAEIVVSLDAAGDHAGARALVPRIRDAEARARTLRTLGQPVEAIAAAAGIGPQRMHIPSDRGSFWEEQFDQRQAFLLQLVVELAGRGDLVAVRRAMEALDDVPDRAVHADRARALLELARHEPPGPTLRGALAEVDLALEERPGERRDKAELLARIAEGLAASGERPAAVPLLDRAIAVLGPTDSIEHLEYAMSVACEGLVQVARAAIDVGERGKGLALLDRCLALADAQPVPPAESPDDSSWDRHSSTLEDRVTARLRVIAALEEAGEAENARLLLARTLAELESIPSEEWRGYAWRSLVEAYRGVGHLDRAIELLAATPPNSGREMAIFELSPEELLAAPREQLWRLLATLPPSYGKVELASELAGRLEAQGTAADAERLATLALGTLVTRFDGWELALVRLGAVAPEADRPPGAERAALLRELRAPGAKRR